MQRMGEQDIVSRPLLNELFNLSATIEDQYLRSNLADPAICGLRFLHSSRRAVSLRSPFAQDRCRARNKSALGTDRDCFGRRALDHLDRYPMDGLASRLS